jgi:ketosteroid isomerase-like protein
MPTTSPTTDNGRTIAAMYEAFGRGDVPFVLERIAPEVEWIETEAQSIPTNGRSSTPEEVLQNVFAKMPEHFETFELRPELWIEKGEDVAGHRPRARPHAIGPRSGRAVRTRVHTARRQGDAQRQLP